MHRLAGRRIFTVGDRVFAWEDVVLAAHLWGDIAHLEGRVAAQLAAEQRLKKAGAEVLEAEVDEAAERWRYERDLIAADDLESWLSERGLTAEEWLAWVHRALAAANAAPARSKRPVPGDVEPLLFVDGMSSGLFAGVIDRLAGRAAVFEREASERKARATSATPRDAALAKLPPAVRRRGLFGLTAADTIGRARSIAEMDTAYSRFVKRTADARALEREVESHALDWTRVGADMVAFDSDGPAREVALLVREDGMPFAKAAAVAKATVVSASLVLEDVGGALHDRLAAAQPGDLVGPIETEDGFSVTLVTERVAPSVDDRRIRSRARERTEQRIVGAEIDKRVRWHERF